MAKNYPEILTPEEDNSKKTLAGKEYSGKSSIVQKKYAPVSENVPFVIPSSITKTKLDYNSAKKINDGESDLRNYIRAALYASGEIKTKTYEDQYTDANNTVLKDKCITNTDKKLAQKRSIYGAKEPKKKEDGENESYEQIISLIKLEYTKGIKNPISCENLTSNFFKTKIGVKYNTLQSAIDDLSGKFNTVSKSFTNVHGGVAMPADAGTKYSPVIWYEVVPYETVEKSTSDVYAKDFGIGVFAKFTYEKLAKDEETEAPIPVISIDIRRPEYNNLNGDQVTVKDNRFSLQQIGSGNNHALKVKYTSAQGYNSSYTFPDRYSLSEIIYNTHNLFNKSDSLTVDLGTEVIQLKNAAGENTISLKVKQEFITIKGETIPYKEPTDLSPDTYYNYSELKLKTLNEDGTEGPVQSVCYKESSADDAKEVTIMRLNFYFEESGVEEIFNAGIIPIQNTPVGFMFVPQIIDQTIDKSDTLKNILGNYSFEIYSSENTPKGSSTTFYEVSLKTISTNYIDPEPEIVSIDFTSNVIKETVKDAIINNIYSGVIKNAEGGDVQTYGFNVLEANKLLDILNNSISDISNSDYTTSNKFTHQQTSNGKSVMLTAEEYAAAGTSSKASWMEMLVNVITHEIIRVVKNYLENQQVAKNKANIESLDTYVINTLVPYVNKLLYMINQHELWIEDIQAQVENDRLNINFLKNENDSQQKEIDTLKKEVDTLKKEVVILKKEVDILKDQNTKDILNINVLKSENDKKSSEITLLKKQVEYIRKTLLPTDKLWPST